MLRSSGWHAEHGAMAAFEKEESILWIRLKGVVTPQPSQCPDSCLGLHAQSDCFRVVAVPLLSIHLVSDTARSPQRLSARLPPRVVRELPLREPAARRT